MAVSSKTKRSAHHSNERAIDCRDRLCSDPLALVVGEREELLEQRRRRNAGGHHSQGLVSGLADKLLVLGGLEKQLEQLQRVRLCF